MRSRGCQEEKEYFPCLVLLGGSDVPWLMEGTDVNISGIH